MDFALHHLNNWVGVGKIRDTSFWDLHNFRESSQPVECLYEGIKHREKKQSIVFMNNLTN